jgi:hypothetical protein
MESEAITFEVPSRYLSAFIKMADACRHIDTTAEHVAAMLNSPHVDVVISTVTPSARAVTFCAIGNAYGGLPSNLIFRMDRFLVAAYPRDSRFSPLVHRGAPQL